MEPTPFKPKFSPLAIAALLLGLWHTGFMLMSAGLAYLGAWTNQGGEGLPEGPWVPSALFDENAFLTAPQAAALILGTTALISIRRSRGTLRGTALTVAGMALGLLPLVVLLLWLLPWAAA